MQQQQSMFIFETACWTSHKYHPNAFYSTILSLGQQAPVIYKSFLSVWL